MPTGSPVRMRLTKTQREKLATLGQRYIKSADPTVNDDSGAGYGRWDKWLNQTTGEAYVCLDATAGAADWQAMSLDADDLAGLFDAKVSHDLATAENDFLVGAPTPFGTFVKKTLVQTKTILGWVLTSTAEAVGFTISGGSDSKTLTVDETKSVSDKVDKSSIQRGDSTFNSTTGQTISITAVADTDYHVAIEQRAASGYIGEVTIKTKATNSFVVENSGSDDSTAFGWTLNKI